MKWWQSTHQGESPVSAEPGGLCTASTNPAERQWAQAQAGFPSTMASKGRSQSSHIPKKEADLLKVIFESMW